MLGFGIRFGIRVEHGFAVDLIGIRVKVRVWVGFGNTTGVVVCVGFGIECGAGLLLGIWTGIGAGVDFGIVKGWI